MQLRSSSQMNKQFSGYYIEEGRRYVLWAELLRSDPERELPERCLVVHFIDSVKVFLCTVDGSHRPHLRMRHLALVIVVVSSANVGRFVLDCTGGTLRVERLRMQLIHINCQVVFQVLSGILVQLQKLIPLVFQVLSELAQVGEVLDGLLCELRFSDLLFFLNGFVKVCVEFRIPHQELVECHCDQIPPDAEYADVRNFHIHSPFLSCRPRCRFEWEKMREKVMKRGAENSSTIRICP